MTSRASARRSGGGGSSSFHDRDYDQADLPESAQWDLNNLICGGVLEDGPPPDMRKRKLIFDSLQKIISKDFDKETRSTFFFNDGEHIGVFALESLVCFLFLGKN